MNLFKTLAEPLLASLDVRTTGERSFDLLVHDPRFYRRALLEGSLGVGESYVDGWWDCRDLEELVFRLVAHGAAEKARRFVPRGAAMNALARVMNLQPRALRERISQHYNTDNQLFSDFLGKYKIYSCAYFRDREDDLDAGQMNKLNVICDRLDLRAQDRVLDVGGGWGEVARHMATTRGCHVTSVNISDEQIRYARGLCAGLPVDIVRSDYRDIAGSYDKVAIIAMLSHVGVKNHRAFFEKIHSLLAPGGAVVIDTVGANVSLAHGNPWIDRYIFPGAVFPSLNQISRATEGLFVVEEVQNHGPSYVKTLRAWNANLQRHWPELSRRHGERTRRTFEFFFQCVAGYFRARDFQNYCVVLSKAGAVPSMLRAAVERPRVAASSSPPVAANA